MLNQELSNFIHVEGGRNLPGGKFTRNEMMTVSDIGNWRTKNNNTGLYLTAYLYDSQDTKEANLYGNFYLDFDSEDDFEKARQDALSVIWYLKQPFTYNIPEAFIRIYFSGKKGLHIVVPATVLDLQPHKHLNEYFKVMALKVAEYATNETVDRKIYDRRRLFRLFNSKHHDTLLYKIPLTCEELNKMSYEDIKEKAKNPVALPYCSVYPVSRAKAEFAKHIEDWNNRFANKFNKSGKFASKPLDFIPPCVQELEDGGPVKGQRNNSAAALTSFYKKQGSSEAEAWDKLVKWNNSSLPQQELENVLKSVYASSYEYGCSTLKELATCSESCKLYKPQEDK